MTDDNAFAARVEGNRIIAGILRRLHRELAEARAERDAARTQVEALLSDRSTPDDMERAARFHQEDAITQRQQKRAYRAALQRILAIAEARADGTWDDVMHIARAALEGK